ncbi:hypothetical protein [Staphylococcus intermedius]|uniref:Uncharacterized protein n=3 Tax=Staphylococcus intermedius TaxID=1285 RepID=A0A380G6L4_STAIN|nr:hypothetical protein [Staphylococcus intermedius]PCF64592.1 hypothetical protein B5C04_00690 [Staphylococcus intermedius]PCF80202.1 hypothetical protein B4W74_00705 [Staphylococcus intermedius]PCF81552.1 hypothetical protein B4W70_00690 [Staphylococcus intermedius]PCF84312.1 hypothetical protein B4W76_11745 [Staphylococcus intermedius]PNZ50946.1 hypothetical protein CD138_10690 [Staphylococcus intermedius NCTC 11048]
MSKEQKRYIHDINKLKTYLKSVNHFRDYKISSFSYDNENHSMTIIIESSRILPYGAREELHLIAAGVRNFYIKDVDKPAEWSIKELQIWDEMFQFQLNPGHLSFKVMAFSLIISNTLNDKTATEMLSVNINDMIQVFKYDSRINDMSFSFKQDETKILHYIGVTNEEHDSYWSYFSDASDLKRFHTAEELFNARIYDDQSLRELWSEVTIIHLNGMPIAECFSQFEKSIKIRVDESVVGLSLNDVTVDGHIIKDKVCHSCGANACYVSKYDNVCCPYCNIWLDESRRHQNQPFEPELIWNPYKLLRFCHVEFRRGGKAYTYYCSDQNVQKGDWVIVPVGISNIEKEVQVVKTFQATANHPPYPLHKIKTIIRKLPSLTEEVASTVASLVKLGTVCDLTQRGTYFDRWEAYDILKTPIGHFWLEYNGEPVTMLIDTIFPSRHAMFFVEGAYYLKPCRRKLNDFQQLKICTDVNLRRARYIDNLGVRRQDGSRWQLNDYDIGIAISAQEVINKGVATNALGIPYLEEWYDEYKYEHIFSVIWKYYESDEDASLWFNVVQ